MTRSAPTPAPTAVRNTSRTAAQSIGPITGCTRSRSRGCPPSTLLFQELIVGGRAAEARRQHFLQHPDHVGVQEGHSPGRELLVAPDRVQVGAPAEPLQGAAAPPRGHHGVVTHRDVEQDERGRASEGGDEEGIAGKARRRPLRSRPDQRVEIVEEVDVVGGRRREAAVADGAALDASVARRRFGAGPADRGQAGRRDGFASAP